MQSVLLVWLLRVVLLPRLLLGICGATTNVSSAVVADEEILLQQGHHVIHFCLQPLQPRHRPARIILANCTNGLKWAYGPNASKGRSQLI